MLRPALCFVGLVSVLAITSITNAQTVLQNGATVTPYPDEFPFDSYRYYGCQDTLLDPAYPDANFGRLMEHGLVAGSGQKILIQFRELHRAVPVGHEIVGATLTLSTVPGAWTEGNDIALYRVLKPWRQGSHTDADLLPQHWTSSYNARLHSDDPSEALAWETPGASGSGTDRAASPSLVINSSSGLSPTSDSWRIRLSRTDMAAFFENHHDNFGWVIEYADPDNAVGENVFYSSEVEDIALRPRLDLIVREIQDPAPRDVDLNVMYIARTPEYLRYAPNYEYKTFHDEGVGLLKNPGNAASQKWPNNGDEVTFTAHVMNKGLSSNSGPFTYRWLINGQVIASGSEPVGLAPGEKTTYSADWTWDANDFANDLDLHRKSLDSRDRTVTFEVDYDDQIAEQSENNNQITDFIEAPGMGFYVEQSMYDMFNDTMNQTGTYSFEDWIQWKVRVWNQSWLEMSRFEGFAEDGALERVRIQKIQVVPDGNLNPGGNHVSIVEGTNYYIDGEWGFLPDANYVAKWSRLVEWGLLHECTHQLGMIDLYTMNMETGTPTDPTKVQVKDGTPYYITRGYYPPYGGLMGGGDTRYNEDYEATGLMSAWTVGALNSNVGYRRGFYGEQLYDVPDTVKLRAVDPAGNPIPNAEIKVWQSRAGSMPDETLYDWQPIFEGIADEYGVVTLPNYGTLEPAPFTTITGHTLKPNPWGRINVVGVNGAFLVKASAAAQRDYRFMRIEQINIEHWRGATEEVVFDLEFQIANAQNLSGQNIAPQGTAQTHTGSSAANAIDGDLDTRLLMTASEPGDFIEIDLGTTHDVAVIQLIHNGYANDFFDDFRIETSTTGAFAGEEILFNEEPLNWDWAANQRRDINPANFDIRTVTYAGVPLPARFVRITAEAGGNVHVAEIRVFEDLPNADTTPPAQITDLAAVDVSRSAARLTWTEPGDDGFEGTIAGYDMRYATFPLTEENFASGQAVPNTPVPLGGGTQRELLLDELDEGVTYYVAVQTRDDQFQWSPLSNVAVFTTSAGGNCMEFTALTAPFDSSFVSAMTTDGANLYFLRRDNHALFVSSDDGASWSTLSNVAGDLGNYHGDWIGELLDYSPSFGPAGSLFTTHRDGDGTQRVARYDIASDQWTLTDAYPAFSHGGVIVDDYYYGIAHAIGLNFGGPFSRVDLSDLSRVIHERTGLNGIIGDNAGWFSRAATLAQVDGVIYGVKNDWVTPNGTGDRLYRFDPADFQASGYTGSGLSDLWNDQMWQGQTTDAEDLGELPFEVGVGSAVVGLPANWSCDIGSAGGLLIIAGRQPSDHEGWGPASSDFAIFDIATQTLNYVGELPAVTGSGTSATFHEGAVYIKRGGDPDAPYNPTMWRVTALPQYSTGDVNCDGAVDFFDIDAFVTALVEPNQYSASYPSCDAQLADVNNDGVVDFFDIDPFVALLVGN